MQLAIWKKNLKHDVTHQHINARQKKSPFIKQLPEMLVRAPTVSWIHDKFSLSHHEQQTPCFCTEESAWAVRLTLFVTLFMSVLLGIYWRWRLGEKKTWAPSSGCWGKLRNKIGSWKQERVEKCWTVWNPPNFDPVSDCQWFIYCEALRGETGIAVGNIKQVIESFCSDFFEDQD
jgi:hypothetical protein